jgi:hypothetical protein
MPSTKLSVASKRTSDCAWMEPLGPTATEGLIATRLPGELRALASPVGPLSPVTIWPFRTIELGPAPGSTLNRVEEASLKSGVSVDTKSELTLTVDPVPKIKPLGLMIHTAPLVDPNWLPLKAPEIAPLIWLVPPPARLINKEPRG